MKHVLCFLLTFTSFYALANDVENLIEHRLNLCVDVAHYKVLHRLPITNVNQEKKVLAAAQKKAMVYHLRGLIRSI
ncbi:chorismate mutase [Shewanella sp. 202IG2-18]|nr:chorismate mutase [Parashewanella hymeniacidonis]